MNNTEWISIQERIPKNYVEVLTYDEQANINIGYLKKSDGYYKCDYGYDWSWPVTHWMPLPTSPKSRVVE